ncbi:unnamed protein product [Vitrella brassicaformis CCMP3155]|uniref:Uncharacterized protein n=1 Tax=Vitrella brassicaformis (strain CCMP3155) TaxID=1169540 RepID=A0A0G4GCC6_VITBC|nr:unnamed protein product [Vitrella brassicaformis CCMP3155]|eukprot:CEM26632.1 unnamed protein product [Vitrella brassicaformis CCMP3155]
MGGQGDSVGGVQGSGQIQPSNDGNAGAAPNGGEAGQQGQGDGNVSGDGDAEMGVQEEERAAADTAVHQASLSAYVNQHAPQQQAGHTANNLTLPGVVSKKAAELVLERKKLKLHALSGGQAGFPTFAFEVQGKCYAAKISYLLNKNGRDQGRAIHGTVQYEADNAHLHAALLDSLMPNSGQLANAQALAVIQQVPAGDGAAAWDALMESFQPTRPGAWSDAFARVVNWQCDLTWNFETAVTDFMHVVQRANELRQLQGVHLIDDLEMVEFFVNKLPASFGRVREAVVIDPSAKYNFGTLSRVCRQWADFTGSAAQ